MKPAPRQLDTLRVIAAGLKANGYAPTLEELCAAFGWASKHTAWLHVRALETKGLLQRAPKSARAMRITRSGRRWLTTETPAEILRRAELVLLTAALLERHQQEVQP